MKEIWTKKAQNDFLEISQFTLNIWGPKILSRFEKDLEKALNRIRAFPNSFPKSEEFEGTRRCLINRHVSLYYDEDGDKITILRLHANRDNPDKLK